MSYFKLEDAVYQIIFNFAELLFNCYDEPIEILNDHPSIYFFICYTIYNYMYAGI